MLLLLMIRFKRTKENEIWRLKSMNLKKFAISSLLALSVFTGTMSAEAATNYKVQPGDMFWKIATKHGVSVTYLMKYNNRQSSLLYAGETIKIPASVTAAEKDLMARLVEAEAKGEPYAGKVAVATVILNRVDSPLFPNTISGVIYQANQFTPVKTGSIHQPASADSKRAVQEALAFRGQGSGSLYFYNPQKTSNQWLRSKQVTVVIGNHVFAK